MIKLKTESVREFQKRATQISTNTLLPILTNLKLSYSGDICTLTKNNIGAVIGGVGNTYVINRPLMRKCMNSFFCSVDRPFQFIGAMNEDVNTYVTLGSRGDLFGTIPTVVLSQTPTQAQGGGITGMYLRYGTYCKAFTTVMMHPSGVKISLIYSAHPRIHHSINWNNTTPMILDERYKKC